MRIAFHAWRDLAHPQAGGSERLVDWLAEGLVHRGHEVVLCAGSPVEQRAYRVVPTGGRFDHYLRMPFAHHRQLDHCDLIVDVVSGMTYFSPWWQRSPTILLHTHVHTEQWDAMFPRPVAALGKQIESRLIPLCYRRSLIVTISDSSAAGLQTLGFDADRLRILPVPSDVTPLTGPRSTEPLFVCVGRLVPYKRVDVLLDMWRDVHTAVGGTLVIVGDGPDRAALEERAGPGVVFTGFATDEERTQLQHDAWIQAHPAAHEGWGIVITEAGAHGTPTLAYRVPGVRDAIEDGVSGQLVDTDAEFVQAWIDLTRDATRRGQLGAGALRMWEEHSVDAAVEAFEGFANEAVGHSRRR